MVKELVCTIPINDADGEPIPDHCELHYHGGYITIYGNGEFHIPQLKDFPVSVGGLPETDPRANDYLVPLRFRIAVNLQPNQTITANGTYDLGDIGDNDAEMEFSDAHDRQRAIEKDGELALTNGRQLKLRAVDETQDEVDDQNGSIWLPNYQAGQFNVDVRQPVTGVKLNTDFGNNVK